MLHRDVSGENISLRIRKGTTASANMQMRNEILSRRTCIFDDDQILNIE